MAELIAHGVDLVETARVASLRERHGERFLHRIYTKGERSYALESRRADERLAARFAAKEAVLKALGTGLRQGIAWTDIEVVRGPNGEPEIALRGRAAAIARERGIARWLVSLSHTREHAMASVIGMGARAEPPR